jgi:hypothetical protein
MADIFVSGALRKNGFPCVVLAVVSLVQAVNKYIQSTKYYVRWLTRTITTMQKWFAEGGLTEIEVKYGHNGIEGRSKKPKIK